MSRFYVPEGNIRKNEITIDGKEAHHIIDVMRLKETDKVVVFDGTGNEYTGFIKGIDPHLKNVSVEVVRVERPAPESIPEVILAQAIPKKSKMDYIVEKASELGASRVIPLVTERTIVRPDSASSKRKVERWRKIAVAAAKQCGRTSIPKITKISTYGEALKNIDQYDLAIMACLSGETVSIRESLAGIKAGKIIVFIGPEGDFTDGEIEMFNESNCKHVSLGQRVLKSDTAGLFVLSVLNYEFS
jgi:16S rRNA (uracil1498-N3)-methyltransferase